VQEKRFEKHVDLHESEWAKADKKEPILGAGAAWFFQVTVPTMVFAIVFSYAVKFIVYGLFG
jgi:hypothetical protein